MDIKKLKHIIRPFSFISSLFVFYVAMFLDGNIITIKDIYIEGLNQIVIFLGSAYIGGRTFEKINALKNDKGVDEL